MTAPKTTFKKADPATRENSLEAFRTRMSYQTAPAWRPEPGDILEGEVVHRMMGETAEYGTYPIIVYKTFAGDIFKVHAFHSLLRERLGELKTDVGMVQRLAFVGEETSNKRKDSNDNPQKYYAYYVENVDGNNPVKEEIAFGF